MRICKFLLITLIGFLVACSGQKEQNQEETKSEQRHYVTTIKAVKDSYVPIVTATGTVFAVKEANVGATLPGKLEKLLVNKGDYVNSGQLLARMSGELLTQASIELDALEKDYNRVKRLHANGSITDQKLDHVKAKYDASRAKVDMLLKNTEIRAPFSGIVTDFLLQEGENYFFSPNIKPGFSMTSGIVQLMQINPVEVRFDINEQDLSRIKEGQHVNIRLAARGDTLFEAKINNIPDVLSTQTRSVKATAQLANPQRMIKPGMSAQVDILTESQEAIFVPLEAIFRPQGTADSYVFVLKDNISQRVKVKQIAVVGTRVAVQGIDEATEVIVAGRNGLVSGDEVIVNRK